jgi:hypothetical protein
MMNIDLLYCDALKLAKEAEGIEHRAWSMEHGAWSMEWCERGCRGKCNRHRAESGVSVGVQENATGIGQSAV